MLRKKKHMYWTYASLKFPLLNIDINEIQILELSKTFIIEKFSDAHCLIVYIFVNNVYVPVHHRSVNDLMTKFCIR